MSVPTLEKELDVGRISKKARQGRAFLELQFGGLVDRVDDGITTNQHHRNANKKRNKKNGPETSYRRRELTGLAVAGT